MNFVAASWHALVSALAGEFARSACLGTAEAVRGVEIVLEQGRTVRVPAGFDRQTLADVLAVLEARSC